MKRRYTLSGSGQRIPPFDVETAWRGEFRMYDRGRGTVTCTAMEIPMMIPVAVWLFGDRRFVHVSQPVPVEVEDWVSPLGVA